LDPKSCGYLHFGDFTAEAPELGRINRMNRIQEAARDQDSQFRKHIRGRSIL
jgi:hypothetical protein